MALSCRSFTFGEPALPFNEAYAPLLGRFDRYNLPALRSVQKIEYQVAANWKLIFENYSECYHCPTVHPQLVKLSPADSGANDLGTGPFLGGYMQVPRPGGSMTTSGQACATPVGNLPPEDFQRVYYYSIFPNVLLSLHHDFVMVHTLWPESPGHTRIECEWLFRSSNPAAAVKRKMREASGKRDVTLIATGSEVGLAVAAADLLAKDGVKAAVVSMPSFELFRAQSEAYRQATLGDAPRVAVEAAIAQGWHEWLRPKDRFIGMNGFGASAPAGKLFEHFGITAPKVAAAAKALI